MAKKSSSCRIMIKKDYYRKGYYSIHKRCYKNGKMTYEKLLDYYKKKRDAEAFRKMYKKGKTKGIYD